MRLVQPRALSEATQTALALYSPPTPPDFASPPCGTISGPAQPVSSTQAPNDPAVELEAAGLRYPGRPPVLGPSAISDSARIHLLRLAVLPVKAEATDLVPEWW